MKMGIKKELVLGIVIGALGTAAVGAGGLYAAGIRPFEKETVISSILKGNEKLEDLEEIIEENYLYDIDAEYMADWIYTGIVYGLDDIYSGYYTTTAAKELMQSVTSNYCGIGAQVVQTAATKEMEVVEVLANSPAEKGGILKGDKIIAVDGTDIRDLLLDTVVDEYIMGEEGTEVTVSVYRPSTEETLDIKMVRANVENVSVKYEMLENHIGYIAIESFLDKTNEEIIKAMEDLESQGMEKVIFDVRGNPGGVLEATVDTLAYLLPEGEILHTEDKYGRREQYVSKDGLVQFLSDKGNKEEGYPKEDTHEVSIPMAVLINEKTASAAELFTSALKDYGMAEVIGANSFGKGIVQDIYSLGDGSMLKLTGSEYFTKSGTVIHKKGIAPDITVESEKIKEVWEEWPLEEDKALQKALEYFKEQ